VLLNSSPTTVEGLNQMPILTVHGATVYIKDVAQVRDGYTLQNQHRARQRPPLGIAEGFFSVPAAEGPGLCPRTQTARLLAKHVCKHCEPTGRPSLKKFGRGTVSKTLSASQVHPHKIHYYLERRDP
jgi:uncharacterized protein YwbE